MTDEGEFGEQPIQRLKRVKVADVVRGRSVPIRYYVAHNDPVLPHLKFKPITQLLSPYIQPVSHKLDLLWHAGWYFCGEDNPRPNWSGFMQDITVGTHLQAPGHFRVLPIIDLNPGDKSCILSTLLFVQEQAKALSMETACITFDQPLWIKAVEVVTANSLNVVYRLGVFHMLMSYCDRASA